MIILSAFKHLPDLEVSNASEHPGKPDFRCQWLEIRKLIFRIRLGTHRCSRCCPRICCPSRIWCERKQSPIRLAILLRMCLTTPSIAFSNRVWRGLKSEMQCRIDRSIKINQILSTTYLHPIDVRTWLSMGDSTP